MNTKQVTAQSWGRFLVDAVREYSKQNNLKFELFSGDWIMRLEAFDKLSPGKTDKLGSPATKYLFGNDFGINNTSARAICNDKSATYQVLTREDVPVLEHRILLRPETLGAPENTYTLAKQAFKDFGNKVICKPNSGSSGSDIVLVESQESLQKVLDELFIKYRAITISPFVNIDAEYRVCILDDSVELMYEKVRQGGELQHNLSHGAEAQDITDTKLIEKLGSLASKSAKALNGTFVHVDIIDVAGKLQVLEVNSGIMFEHYSVQSPDNRAKATEIYHKALDLLFT